MWARMLPFEAMYGGLQSLELLQKFQNTRARKIDAVTVSIGINDCMSTNFSAVEVGQALENIV